MALPQLTDEQRKAALEKAAEARKKRAELKASLKRGETTLKDVLEKADTDEIILSLIHISEPTRRHHVSRMPSSA